MPKSLAAPSPVQPLHNFTNRVSELAALNAAVTLPRGTTLPVLMFYGVGGIGKSWLLRKLKAELAEHRPFLPTALLDFDPRSGGTVYHTDSSKALAHIRQQFKDVLCPRFDLAYAWLRYKEGTTEEPLLKGSGPVADALEVVKGAVGALAGVPGVGHGIKKLTDLVKKKVFKKSRLEKWLAETSGQEDFLRLRSADVQLIYPELADRFLRDLAENLVAQDRYACRAVIFIDTFEALSREVQGRAQLHERQSWVRELHAENCPVLLVLAGRDQLLWDEHDAAYADPKYLNQTLVGGLSEGDSREFLGKEGIADTAFQDAILRVSEGTRSEGAERGYHSLSLYLCAKTVVNDVAAKRAINPSTFGMKPGDLGELAQRFLKSLPDPAQEVWVRRLALTPRFDEPAARGAFSATPGAVQDAAWEVLRGYSFVQETDEDGWWTLHAKMRDALATGPTVEAHHRDWQTYWRGRAKSDTDTAASLVWYHGWRRDPADGLRTWNALAESLRRNRRMADHQEIVDWWEPTGLLRTGAQSPTDAGALNDIGIEYTEISLGNRAAHLRRAIGCFEAALRVRTEADFPQDWAMTQNNLGNAYSDLPTGDRGENLRRAIGCFEAALRVYTEADFPQDWAMTQLNRGLALVDLAESTATRSHLQTALEAFQFAERGYTAVGVGSGTARAQIERVQEMLKSPASDDARSSE
ncbi:MAG: hypothetical protein J0I06_06970 [Planctomycetes bacterium]|nr:hypothetical protein [Planctomycetota bacterium]